MVQPKRIILDRQGQLPLSAKILQNPETVMVMTPFRQELADLGVIHCAATFKSIIAGLGSTIPNL